MSAQPSSSLYVGDLHRDVSEGTVFEHFNKVGPVASIRVCRDATTRESLGYAYVNFQNPTDADRALDTMNFTLIRGVPCRIMWSQRDPALRRSGLGNIFVKKLSERVDNKILYDHFSVFGNILSCKVAAEASGKSKGYGYVHFETEKAADDAILKLNNQLMDDQIIQVEKFLPKANRKETDPNSWTNVYIKNIPPSWTDDNLMELVKEFGTVQSAVVKSKVINGNARAFAFANFTEHDMALACVAGLNEREIEGQKISVTEALTKHQLARRRTANVTSKTNLYVRGFEENLTNEEFSNLFKQFGAIRTARIMRQPVEVAVPNEDPTKPPLITTSYTGESKGFGFVNFENPESATAAIQAMDGFIQGRGRLYVAPFQNKEERRNNMAQHRQRYPPTHPGMPYMGAPMFPPFMGGGRPYQYQYRNQHFPRQYPPRQPAQFNYQFQPQQQPQYMGYNQPPMPGQYQNNMRPTHMRKIGQQGQQNNMRSKTPRTNLPPQQQQIALQQQPSTVAQVAPPVVVVPAAPVETASMSYAQTLAQMDPQEQKNSLGEALYPMIYNKNPSLAGKITGMLLEMDNAELVNLLESPDALSHKVEEALTVLRSHGITN